MSVCPYVCASYVFVHRETGQWEHVLAGVCRCGEVHYKTPGPLLAVLSRQCALQPSMHTYSHSTSHSMKHCTMQASKAMAPGNDPKLPVYI